MVFYIHYWTVVQKLKGKPCTTPSIQCLPGFFQEVKQLTHEAHHSPPSNAKVEHEWSSTSALPYILSWSGQGRLYFSYPKMPSAIDFRKCLSYSAFSLGMVLSDFHLCE